MAKTKQKRGTPVAEHKWEESLSGFMEWLEANERSTHTRRNYRHDLHQFQLWYEHPQSNARPLKTISQINAVQFREWKSWLQRPAFSLVPGEKTRAAATATVNRRISAMHSFLEWAFNTRRLEGQVEKPKVVRQKRLGHRGLEKKDERDLLDSAEGASPRDRAIIHIFLYSGLRADELAQMKWSNLKINGREWGFLFQGKGNKTRYVPAHSKTVAALKVLGWAEHRGTDRRIVDGQRGPVNCRAIQAVCEKLGVNAHKLRHTFAHNFLKGGGGIEQLADILGHEDLETTRRYVVSSTGDLHAAMERMGAED